MRDIDAAIDEANDLFYREKFKKALAIYEDVVKESPDDERGYCGAILSLLSLERPDDALARIDALIRLVPDEAYPHGVMGTIMEVEERVQDALACYDRMLRIDPADSEALLRKAVLLHGAGREKEAEECIEKLAASASEDEIDALAGSLDGATDEESDEGPDYGMPSLQEMIGILTDGDLEEIEVDAESTELMGLANELAGEGKHGEAAAVVGRVIEKNPSYTDAHSIKAMLLVEDGRYEEAIACVDAVLRAKPDEAADLGVKAMLLERVGRRDEAAACYDRLIEAHPGETSAYYLKCSMLAEAGDAEGVAECYRAAMRSEPSDSEGKAAKKAMRSEYRKLERCTKEAGSMEGGFAKFMKKTGVKKQPLWGRGPGKGGAGRKIRKIGGRLRGGRRR